MAAHKLQNYLRTYRKKSGLTQREVGYLLGWKSGGSVARYEKRRRLPPLQTALAYEAILGVPLSKLFAGIHDTARKNIQKRMVELRSKLQAKTRKGSEALLDAHKLRWLADRESPQPVGQNITTS